MAISVAAVTSAANSEVLPAASVAVALMPSPTLVAPSPAVMNEAFPLPSVVTVVEPR